MMKELAYIVRYIPIDTIATINTRAIDGVFRLFAFIFTSHLMLNQNKYLEGFIKIN